MENNWQNKLRETLGNYEKAAPEGLWEGVGVAVNNKLRSRSRKAMIWALSSAAVAAVVAFAVFLSVESRQPATDVGHAVAENHAADEPPAADILSASGLSYDEVMQNPAVAVEPVLPEWEELSEFSEDTGDAEASGSVAVSDVDAKDSDGVAVSDEEPPLSDNGTISERDDNQENDAAIWPFETEKSKLSANRLSIGLSSSNSVGSGHSQGGYGGLYGSDAAMMAQAAVSGFRSQKFSYVLINNNGEDVKTSIRHRQPVRIGISVDYGLTKALGAETGLTYTLLMSDLTSGSSGGHYETRQTLHYIGIPLNLKIRLLDFANGNGKLYLSSGGMVEKCVFGQTKTDYYISGEPVQSGLADRLTVKPLQWSVNAAIGCSYAIGDVVSVYIEPGISYYFDNNSPVETIYNERPLNFSLRTGLRFSFLR